VSIKIQINTAKIKSFNPCKARFDNWVEQYGDFNGDILDFLYLDKITETDKIWVAVRVLPREQAEYFAIDSAFAAASAASYAAAAYASFASFAAAFAAASASASAAAASASFAAYASFASFAAYASFASFAAAFAAAVYSCKKERERQIEALIYLISTGDE
jgi:hypothetical protein